MKNQQKRAIDANRYGSDTKRYYLRIQTSPESGWMTPHGWDTDDRAEAIAMARKADAQWMRVRLVDGNSGNSVAYRARRASTKQ